MKVRIATVALVVAAAAFSATPAQAATAGNASRQIYVNGATVAANLSFPGTGAWTTWNTVAVTNVALVAGNNTLSVIFSGPLGSGNWLNLDEATLRYQ